MSIQCTEQHYPLSVLGAPAFRDIQTAIQAAWEGASYHGVPRYAYDTANGRGGGLFVLARSQPSRFRVHWKIDPDGRLWAWEPPALPPSQFPAEVTYTEIK